MLKQSSRLSIFVVMFTLVITVSVASQVWKPAGPAPRAGHSAVLDTATNSMVVFGGQITSANAAPSVDTNELWRFNNNGSWTPLTATGTLPAGRLWHTSVYDQANNRMIMFGGAEGFSAPCANDVWVLTDANGLTGTPAWSQLTTVGGPPAPRAQHGAAYDPNTNSLIVYGGQDCFATLMGDVWALSNANGLGGTPTWTQLFPTGGGPGPRTIIGSVAYDSANNRLIVFGGAFGGVFNDVWILSNANGQGGTPNWTLLSPTGTPPSARANNSATYDPASNRLTIFGGCNGTSCSNLLGDTWVLANANGLGGTAMWRQLGPFSLFSEVRHTHTAVYNPSTNRMTIFGGFTANASTTGTTTNDVWMLSRANGH